MKKKRIIIGYFIVLIIAIIAITVLSIMVRYNVEGESSVPFEISKVMVISTAGGIGNENSEYKWDLNIVQTNDIGIEIIKNKNYMEKEVIDKVIIDNFKVESSPTKGDVNFYIANNDVNIFNNTEENKITDALTYTGAEASNLKNLEIANQGGLILLRYVNENLGQYTSNEETEITHDGTILKNIELTTKDIKFKVSFDISIELKSGKKYKSTIMLDLPKGDLVQEGTTNYQINKEDIVFKRY